MERKRLDDLRSSMIDGRYGEQKQRIKNSGISHKIYLVEEIGFKWNVSSRPMDQLHNKGLDRWELDNIQDFLINLGINQRLQLLEISISS